MRRGLGTMRGAEGIVDVDIAELRHLLGQLLAVLLLALVAAAVLEQHDFARVDAETAVDPVLDQLDRLAEQFAHARGDRGERIRRLELTFGRTAEMRGHHDRCALLERETNARDRGADARVLGDGAAVVLRHVEIGADEHALVLEIEVGELLEFHWSCGPLNEKARSDGVVTARPNASARSERTPVAYLPAATRAISRHLFE